MVLPMTCSRLHMWGHVKWELESSSVKWHYIVTCHAVCDFKRTTHNFQRRHTFPQWDFLQLITFTMMMWLSRCLCALVFFFSILTLRRWLIIMFHTLCLSLTQSVSLCIYTVSMYTFTHTHTHSEFGLAWLQIISREMACTEKKTFSVDLFSASVSYTVQSEWATLLFHSFTFLHPTWWMYNTHMGSTVHAWDDNIS